MNDTTGRRRVHAFVSGRVQGVYYRLSTQREAVRLGIAGWVRNLADGRVELIAEGRPQDVATLLQWARGGPPDARVDAIEVEERVPGGIEPPFEVRR